MICNDCKNEFEIINQDKTIFNGQLNTNILNFDEVDIEEYEVEKGDIIYYYFDKPHMELIKGDKDVCSRARNVCKICIEDSISKTFEERNPHYGDGVYFTMHDNLNNAKEEIKSCHGSYVAKRTNRVKFMVKEAVEFLKIYKTGGVLKTNEHTTNYDSGFLIFANKDRKQDIIKYMCLEEYRNGEWCCI
ncbi:MAG: hypothetical protein ACRDDY_08710 [Clostridium sp.]|uniref:hypothetical protein n=1 Tax=Clostridium sp. TaxID=1506 RepID=UPI003EE4CB3E